MLQSGSRLAINSAIAANTIMEPLFRMDAGENLVPVLALSAQPSADARQWTIRLRQTVVFHDGTPLDADAVVSHWKRILDPYNQFRQRSVLAPVSRVEKVDAYTVNFHLKHPWLPFQRVLGSTRGLINLIPSPMAVSQGTQNRSPVGTGPFRFEEWKSGDRFVVAKNPAYWRKGLPYLDKIVFKPMPDHQTRFASLITGQLDIIWTDRGHIINKAVRSRSYGMCSYAIHISRFSRLTSRKFFA